MKKSFKFITPIIDILASPITLISSCILKLIRQIGIEKMPVSRQIFDAIGVFPIRDHYYEPLFKKRRIWTSLRNDRILSGIDFNEKEQLDILSQFDYNDELLSFPSEKPNHSSLPLFYYNNPNFKSGDAEFLYNIIRFLKPSKIIEIGSGYSTLIAHEANVKNNQEEDGNFSCEHTCIEPYQRDWLEEIGVNVIRKPVERIIVIK